MATAAGARDLSDPSDVERLRALWIERRDPSLRAALARVAARAPGDVERAIGAFIVRSSSAKTLARVTETLEPLVPDPRVGEALVAFVEAPAFQALSTQPLWEAILAILPRTVDAELVARLGALRGRSIARLGAKTMGAWLDARLEAAWPALEEAARATRPLSAAEAKRIAALVDEVAPAPAEPASTVDAEALWRAVYAAPDDDGPRAVLSDWLIERGDPRGELIALQLRAKSSKEDHKRAKELIAAHGRAWLGPLAAVMGASNVKWARGFPSEGKIAVKRAADWERLASLPKLATLRALDLGSSFDLLSDHTLAERILLQPSLRHLRKVTSLPHRLLPAIADAQPPFSLTEIACAPQMGGGGEAEREAAMTRAFDDGRGLPSLVDLELPYIWGRVSEYPWLGTTRLGRQLASLTISSYDPLGSWLAALRALDAKARLVRLAIRSRGWTATFTRETAGAPWETLTLDVDDPARAASAIEGLAPRSLATISVGAHGSRALDAAVAKATR